MRPCSATWPALCAVSLLAVSATTAARPPRRTVPPLRVTAELRNATLAEASAKLSELLGAEVCVPEKPGSGVDLKRRASFSWSSTPTGQALREISRAYDCRVMWSDYTFDYHVFKPWTGRGPAARVAGFRVSAEGITFEDHRSTLDVGPQVGVDRTLQLRMAVRAEGGDPAAIAAFENVILTDASGRRSRQDPDRAPATLRFITPDGWYPDEWSDELRLRWPHPAPGGTAAIEGDLLLYPQVNRTTVSLPLAVPAGQPEVARVGGLEARLETREVKPRELRARVRLTSRDRWDVPGGAQSAEVVLEDGSRVAVRPVAVPPAGDPRTYEFDLAAEELSSPPVRIDLMLLARSGPLARQHFRVAWPDLPFAREASSAVPPTQGKRSAR
jgi:hypothetical protein